MSTNKFTTNINPLLAAVSSSDAETPVYLYADPVSHALLTSTTLSASSAIIGTVSIDQTTPGTTNRVDIADSLNNPVSAFPATFLRVTDEPHQLFYDAFDTAIDTTNRWTVTSGNSGVAATNSAGVMTMGTGTVANGYSKLASQPSFTLPIPAWLGVSDAIALPDGAAPVANSYRYWGTGTTPATPTVATPVTDGYGFELGTDGIMRAVVYAGGTRTVIQDLSAGTGNGKQPLDIAYHRYIIYIRTDKAYWYIDGITSAQLVATSNFQSSQVQTLPRLMLAIGNASPPLSNATITCTGATAWDTGKNNTQLSDATFPWMKANILSGAGVAGGQNSQLVAGAYYYPPLVTLNVTTPTSAWFDMANYAAVSVGVITNTAAVPVTFQTSSDASNTNARSTNAQSDSGGLVTSSASAVGTFLIQKQGRYFRLFSTIGGANTATYQLTFYTIPPNMSSILSMQQGSWAVGASTATAAATPANQFAVAGTQNTTQPTYTDGQLGQIQIDTRGNMKTTLYGANSSTAVLNGQTPADGATAATSIEVQGFGMFYNGTNWDRGRNNNSIALIAAGTTSTQTGITLTNHNGRGLTLVVNIASGAGTVTVAINGTTVSTYSTNQLTSTALVVGTTALRIFDGATPTTNLVANDKPFRNISVTATVVGTVAYGIDYVLTV